MDWQKYISSCNKTTTQKSILLKYAQNLELKKIPVIFDFEHLCLLLDKPKQLVQKLVFKSEYYYFAAEIPKKKGGVRLINVPHPDLLNVQRWIYHSILKNLQTSQNATAYKKKNSIIQNAKPHLNSDCLLKIDIKDFFPSIEFSRIYYVFNQLGYSKKVSIYLTKLCLLDNKLPQGTPTSPALSNIVCNRLDNRLDKLCRKFDIKYTRYSDDFTFSGEKLKIRFADYFLQIIQNEGFKVNTSKTQFIQKKGRKIITGISISSGKMTIPKTKKREIRKIIYHLLTKGLFSHLDRIGINDPIYIERILGVLYFWKSIEPKNNYVNSSISKLKSYKRNMDKKFSKLRSY